MQENSQVESPGVRLHALVTQRHAAFVEEIWALFGSTVCQLEEQVRVLRDENERHKRSLEEATKKREVPRNKAKRTAPKKPDPRPDEDVEVQTENSSDSENEWKQNSQAKDKKKEFVVSLDAPSEPGVQTENSSDSEVEQRQHENSQPDPEPAVVLSDPPTENSSESEFEDNLVERGSKSNKKTITQKKKQAFKCTICEKSFNYKSVLKMHQVLHANSRPYECSLCGFSFTMKCHLDRHMEIHKRTRRSEDAADQCSSDSVVWIEDSVVSTPSPDIENATELESTTERERRSKRPQCFQCGKTFSTRGNMAKHIRNLHCKKSTFTRKIKVQVQWRHQHLACPACDRRFRFQSELNMHMKRAHSEKRFQCEICQKRFRDKAYLSEHLRIHSGEKPYKCAVCDKCFTFRKSCNAHMKLHEESSIL